MGNTNDHDDDDDDCNDDHDDDDDECESDYIIQSWDIVHSGFPALLSCICLIVIANKHRSLRPHSMCLIGFTWKGNV